MKFSNFFKKKTIPFPADIVNYHIKFDRFYEYYNIGSQYLCATQTFNHIPNHTALIRKDALIDNIRYKIFLIEITAHSKSPIEHTQRGTLIILCVSIKTLFSLLHLDYLVIIKIHPQIP